MMRAYMLCIAGGLMLAAVGLSIGLADVAASGDKREAPSTQPATRPTMAWFTVDDGQSWFKDDASKLPPFLHDGRQAVRCYVFRVGNGGPFVGYLQRWTPEHHKLVEEARARGTTLTDEELQRSAMYNREFRKPGDEEWVKPRNVEGVRRVTTVVGRDGRPAEAVEP
jgi:hypothetical protein